MDHVVLLAPFEDIGFASFGLFFSEHVVVLAQRAVQSQHRPRLLQPPRVKVAAAAAAEKCILDTTESPVGCFLTERYRKKAMRKRRRPVDHTRARKKRSPGS